MMAGIDVSHWNIVESFDKVRNDGYSFVIIKAGGSDKGFYKDSKFEEYYNAAVKAGLYVGAYYYVGRGFISGYDGEADARRFMEIIKDKMFTMPVYLDLESTDKAAKTGATSAAFNFLNLLEQNGYYAGIYGSEISTFKDRVNDDLLVNFAHWIARYPKKPDITKNPYGKSAGMWQYTDKGQVNGIRGNVDLDMCYVDYPAAIKKHKLNNYKEGK